MSSISGAIAGATEIADLAPVAAALLSQLQRLQQQLAESMNSAAAATPEGRAGIDAIRARISQVEHRIAQSDQVGERRAALLRTGNTEPAASIAAASGTVTLAPKTSGPGQLIDVFA
jgi:hypothetical protein